MTAKKTIETIADGDLDAVVAGAAADDALGQGSTHTAGQPENPAADVADPTGLTENVTLNFRKFNTFS